MTGEIAGFAMEKLLEEGALDVYYTPLHMKKNRPAIQLGVLAKACDKERLQKAILKHTTTIGMRSYEVERVCMERTFEEVIVDGEKIAVKVATYEEIEKYMPEYEDCKRAAYVLGISIQQVYHTAVGMMEVKKRGGEHIG